MKYNRWYDSNESLSEIIEALKISHQSNLEPLAFDIIQLMLEKQPDKDVFLETTTHDYTTDKHRWYDRNYMFHSAMEMLRQLPHEETKALLREILSPYS